jgi:nucleoside-diphosphate-sugar epimerase
VVDVLIQAGFGPAEINEPVNVGSGCAVRLGDLALKIKEITHSPSPIEICPARDLEVDRFQADLHRAGKYFGLSENLNPLDRLSDLVQLETMDNRQ